MLFLLATGAAGPLVPPCRGGGFCHLHLPLAPSCLPARLPVTMDPLGSGYRRRASGGWPAFIAPAPGSVAAGCRRVCSKRCAGDCGGAETGVERQARLRPRSSHGQEPPSGTRGGVGETKSVASSSDTERCWYRYKSFWEGARKRCGLMRYFEEQRCCSSA